MRVLLLADLLKTRNFQPLALEYLSAALKQAGHEVRLADAGFPRRVEETLAGFQPGVVAFSATTGLHRPLLALCRRLKVRFEFFSVFGGPHPTYFPEMIESPGVDAVCRGEGEEALVELVGALERGEAVHAIRNFWFRTPDGVIRNPLRPLIEDLDRLPLPDWSLLDDFPYCREFPVRVFMASRGCPYGCSFCYNPTLRALYDGRPTYRCRDPERVVEEIVASRRHREFQFVYLFDDCFGVKQSWLSRFCELYRERVHLPFFVNFRADALTETAVRAARAAGLAYAGIGLETGDEALRFELLNKRVTDEQLVAAAGWLRKHGVPFATYNIMGLPGTTLEHDLKTLRLNWRLAPDFAETQMFMPYPRTALGDRAVEQGLFSGDPDEIPINFKRRGPMRLDRPEERARLLHLFQILALHPLRESTLRMLLRLPAGPAYRLASRLFEGALKVHKLYGVRLPPLLLARMAWAFLAY